MRVHLRVDEVTWRYMLHAILPHEKDRFSDPSVEEKNFVITADPGEPDIIVINRDSL